MRYRYRPPKDSSEQIYYLIQIKSRTCIVMHFFAGKARCNATRSIETGLENGKKMAKKKGAHARTPNPNRETKRQEHRVQKPAP